MAVGVAVILDQEFSFLISSKNNPAGVYQFKLGHEYM
jgi:hypothetical protein